MLHLSVLLICLWPHEPKQISHFHFAGSGVSGYIEIFYQKNTNI